MMTERVFSQAVVLAGELDGRQQALLRVLCGAAVSSLASRLRHGITPEDCGEDFATAAGLYALADLRCAEEAGLVEEFKAGDLTVKRGNAGAAGINSLQQRAEQLMRPYLKDSFSFLGV